VTITGNGFGTAPPSSPTGCNSTGNQYVDQQLYVQDVTAGWTAGQAGNCIGIIVSSYSNTQIVLSFGSFYDIAPYRFALAAGDRFNVGTNGTTASGTVEFAKIHSVKVTGPNSAPTVTIKGSGFGTTPAGAALIPGCGSTGSDYAAGELYFNDLSESWRAGLPGDCVGIVASSYSDTTIIFTFGSTYATNGWIVNANDSVTVGVAGATKTVTLLRV
jgi:hypothetical protein